MTTTTISSSSSFSLDTCGDECGWIAAFLAAVCYGSFGVPIKMTKQISTTDDYSSHPLVLQSYKTCTMFTMCWLVLLLPSVHGHVDFTPWGLLSGLLWVLGGTGGIYAILNAGLAIAVGTWASVMMCVNFIWGILIFQEPVADIWGTLGAFVLLALGLVGMSYYSSVQDENDNENSSSLLQQVQQPSSLSSSLPLLEEDPAIGGTTTATPVQNTTSIPSSSTVVLPDAHEDDHHRSRPNVESSSDNRIHQHHNNDDDNIATDYRLMMSSTNTTPIVSTQQQQQQQRQENCNKEAPMIVWDVVFFGKRCCKIRLTRRTVGIFGAVFNGMTTGSSLIPLHYAKKQGLAGAHYMISFAIGALLSNTVLWILLYAMQVGKQVFYYSNRNNPSIGRQSSPPTSTLDDGGGTDTLSTPRPRTVVANESSASRADPLVNEEATSTTHYDDEIHDESAWRIAYHQMPSWHCRQLLLPGIAAGILLSLAMFGSIIAVTQLGQGIGNSVVQIKILISGLWGIFWFCEIRTWRTILQWFASALLSVTGIIWLSQERLLATASTDGRIAHTTASLTWSTHDF